MNRPPMHSASTMVTSQGIHRPADALKYSLGGVTFLGWPIHHKKMNLYNMKPIENEWFHQFLGDHPPFVSICYPSSLMI